MAGEPEDQQSDRGFDEVAAPIERREFSMAEAIGRLAGPGAMKGVSPITPGQQAEAAIREFLRLHVADAEGALTAVLAREVCGGEAILREVDRPMAALGETVRRLLGSEPLLREFVREVDREWGRALGERPHFEREGAAPHPDDPYTVEAVRARLVALAKTAGA